MTDKSIGRFMGGSPVWVLLQLVALSVVAGVILSALGLDPFDILNSLRRLAYHLLDFSFGTIEKLWRYFLLGAVVVIPIWILLRFARGFR
ncbi:DUF6460 domain-containing protein [Ancylobacter sp. 6x-1]|uniref:DUF6460 domain-containing protein n=1 Tax=Ancylobacter crimeensis TaxID=2579147 RepID=A0ABT0D7W6_9HYPH|nr:DUF6460 domain-containing protein [Ancylobacter crimeensis]MCK0196048.1 DUF6460 domain-containing protein [Ancylobacter crimeensis]